MADSQRLGDVLGWGVLVVLGLAFWFVVRGFLAPAIIRRRRAGGLTHRQAGWLYGLLLGAPYALTLLLVATTAPSGLPVLLLLMVLTLPVFVIAWVALYRGTGP